MSNNDTNVRMKSECTLQLFADGRWRDAAGVMLLSPPDRGWQARTYTGYAVEWAVDWAGRRDAHALGSLFPVGLQPWKLEHWPVFLLDLLPQGYGRGELLHQLGLPETAQISADWALLNAGAGNPIGNLRVKEAAEWLLARTEAPHGFSDDEVAARSDDFTDYLSMHGLFVAGSSGVQGEWPKILLTRGKDGLLYLDHALPDAEAAQHYIVKFGRGANAALASILRHEAPFMTIAAHLGLRVHKPLELRERALFIPRFDREVTDAGVLRHGQESLAALMGLPGFGVAPPHDDVVARLAKTCTEPAAEVLEYLRRDVANLAFGNKDNHARNTALQRFASGQIRLTPLFDFAPMYLHPDGIARRMRWKDKERVIPDWNAVLDEVCERTGLPRTGLAEGMRALIPLLHDVLNDGEGFGLEPNVHAFIAKTIQAQIEALERIR
jgi:serine/threonine-protein kinase HipA